MGSSGCYIMVSQGMRTARESTPRLLARVATSENLQHQKDVKIGWRAVLWVLSRWGTVTPSDLPFQLLHSTVLSDCYHLIATGDPFDRQSVSPVSSQSHHIRTLTGGSETAKKEHGSISTWAWGSGSGTSYHQVLRAHCFPPYPTYPIVSAADPQRCSTPTRADLVYFGCQAGEMPPFASKTHIPFDVYDFSILWHVIHQQQLIPMTSWYLSSPNTPEYLFTSTFCIAAATPPSPEFEPAENEAWQHTELANTALCDKMDILIGWDDMQEWCCIRQDGYPAGCDVGNKDVAMLENGVMSWCQLSSLRLG